MKHFIVYSLADGKVLRAGTCQDQDFAGQAQPGEGVVEATNDATVVAEVNLNPVRATLLTAIDDAAEATRQQFITPGAGQAMTYLRKEAEAHAYVADSGAPTPFLTAEATARGITVAALAAEVIARAAAWTTIGPKIEAARMGAKEAVKDAANIADMHAAAQVDWAAVVSTEN